MSSSPTAAAVATARDGTQHSLSPESRMIFIGLMCGMLVAAVSQTIVSPAMPRIVAELGGIEHYSWLATGAMLVAAVTTALIGKLSDIFGRRGFYIAGLVVFLGGSVMAGLAPNFWFLVAARAVQGAGMGTLMPLSQTIIGDIIPPRQRGKYQGIMGAVFGICSVGGPLVGGFVTDHFGWRWLFFLMLPFGIAALLFIIRFLHPPHTPRQARVDVLGAVLLTIAMVSILLATSWGGTSYPWASVPVIGLYVVGAVALALFIPVELRASEPILPLRLFTERTFALSAIASLSVGMAMFGAIFYVPVYAQGVLGVNATNSGLIIMPISVAMIVMSIVVGQLITRTGHYKGFMIAGTVLLVGGIYLLTRLHYGSSQLQLTVAMIVTGLGLGGCMQTYVLVVQNVVARSDLGVATSTVTFFRNAGATVGVAILGTVLTSEMSTAVVRHLPANLPPGAGAELSQGAGSVLDPSKLAQLPPVIADAVRMGMADAMHLVFWAAVPLAAIAFIVTLFLPQVELRSTLDDPRAEAEREFDDSAAGLSGGLPSDADPVEANPGAPRRAAR